MRRYILENFVPITNGAAMRNLVLGLVACLAIAGLSKADVVVLDNSSLSGSNNSAEFKITFTAAQNFAAGQALSGIRVFSNKTSAAGGGSPAQVLWELKNSGGTTLKSDIISASVSGSSGAYIYDFTFANITNEGLSSGTVYQLYSSIDSVAQLWQQSSSATISNTSFITSASYNSTANNYAFTLSAVPEPGTLLLGGIATCSGAAGAWWKRRKRKAIQSETTDQPATA